MQFFVSIFPIQNPIGILTEHPRPGELLSDAKRIIIILGFEQSHRVGLPWEQELIRLSPKFIL